MKLELRTTNGSNRTIVGNRPSFGIAITTLIIAGLILGMSLTRAGDATDAQTLLRKVEELEQRVRVLERKSELEREASVEQAKSSPVISASADGFVIRSADTNFVLRIGGYVHADARVYPNSAPGTARETFLLRRARPLFEGTVWGQYDYRLLLDFPSGSAASVQEAYVNARWWREFQVQAGKFKAPVGLERLQMARNLLFVERGYATQLVPNRDLGVQLHGDILGERLNYRLGIFNGTADGASSSDLEAADAEKDFAGRLFAEPFRDAQPGVVRGLGIGLGATYGTRKGAPPKFVSPGQQTFFGYRSGAGTAAAPNVVADGPHWRLVPQGYYYHGPFGLYWEYALSNQRLRRDAGQSLRAERATTAWQVSASWFLTGEDNSWKPVRPRHPFSTRGGGWGAWEVAARIGRLSLDEDRFADFADPATAARRATSWGVGLNWHLNKNLKVNLDFEHTWFSGGTAAVLNRQGEDVILTRVQVAF